LPIADCQLKRSPAALAVRTLLAVALVMLHVAPARAITAGLDRSTIALGGTATLTLTFAGNGPKAVPKVPEVPGLTITYAGQARQLTLINGVGSTSVTLSFQVQGRQPGDYVIPSFTVELESGRQNTPAMQFKVLPPGAVSPAPQATALPRVTPAPAAPKNPTPGAAPTPQSAEMEKFAFVRLVSSRKECYLGEIFPIAVELYYAAGRDIQLPNLRCEGFTVGRMVAEQSAVPMNGALYNLVRFRTLVTPVKTGKLPLGPAECQLMLQIRAPDFFGFRLQQYSPRSEAVEINVLPLPEAGRPAGFTGAVGAYDLTYAAGPTNVQVGDPITVKIQITGRGALDQVPVPSLDEWRDFKTYPAAVKVDMFAPLSVMGAKNLEQVVMPQNAGIRELPPVALSFFDPELKAYRTVNRPGIPITVMPGPGGAQQPTVVFATKPGESGPPAATDIVHIKPHLGGVATWSRPLAMQPWFLALQTIPFAAWLGLLAWRRREDRLANNPRLRRQREVARVMEAGLDELRRHAAANKPVEFYATVFRLLQEQLGERLDLPASAITESVIEERLRPAGVAEAELVALREIFEVCDRARFSGGQDGTSLAVLVPKVESVLERAGRLEVR